MPILMFSTHLIDILALPAIAMWMLTVRKVTIGRLLKRRYAALFSKRVQVPSFARVLLLIMSGRTLFRICSLQITAYVLPLRPSLPCFILGTKSIPVESSLFLHPIRWQVRNCSQHQTASILVYFAYLKLPVVCIHHPQGDVKKISIDNGPVTAEYQNPIPLDLHWLYDESLPQAFWRVIKWETGTTEGGSSGSPLFNQNQLIVGNLTGGQADCSNSVNDYYSKFHMGWDYYSNYSKQLKHWLDPESTGITNLVGFNPYGQNIIQYASRFSVFPNPASSQVTFETDSLDISGGVLSVYSLTGKKMAQYNIKESTRLSFNVSSFNQGMYILEFRKGEIYERKRLVVINPLK